MTIDNVDSRRSGVLRRKEQSSNILSYNAFKVGDTQYHFGKQEN